MFSEQIIQHGLNHSTKNLIIFTGEILRGIRHNYVADAAKNDFLRTICEILPIEVTIDSPKIDS